MCLVAGDKKCSLNKVKKILRNKNLQMANAEEVKIKTGYTIGGVSPIGLIEKMDILIDKSLDRYKNIYAAAGHPNCIFKINFSDLKKITSGKVEEITE
jgi:prolyl-tRNA editing enzyme YbaK/EbsC (Cys-tRNA(Pro) deacylase)